MARAAETEAAKIRAGLVDAKDLARRDHLDRPLSEHVTAWREAMLNQGHTPKHAHQSADRLRRLVAVMSGARPDDIDGKTMSRSRQEEARDTIDRLLAKAKLSDISTERVQAAIATFRDSGRSAQTCNHYQACARAFARSAWKTGRLRDYHLVGLTGYNAKEDRRHDHRTLSLDELTRLIQVTGRGPTFQEMTGPARASATDWPHQPDCDTRKSPASHQRRSTGTIPASAWLLPTRKTGRKPSCRCRTTWRTI